MPISVEFVPNLRAKFVASDGREFDLPAAFEWIDSQNLVRSIFAGNALSSHQCRALWLWLGRTDKPPKQLKIYVSKADFEKLLSQWKKRGDHD